VAMIMGDPAPRDPRGGVDIATGPITEPFQQALALLPSCTATIGGHTEIGRPGIRLADFLANFRADRGRFYTICQSDYSAALADIGNTLFNAVSPCLEGAIDTTDADPSNPGTQLQCTVTDVQNSNTMAETDALIPPCQMQDATTPSPTGAR